MKNNGNSSVIGIVFPGLLSIVFIVLKLTKVIAWSWVWVLAPIWIFAILTLTALAIIALVCRLKDR